MSVTLEWLYTASSMLFMPVWKKVESPTTPTIFFVSPNFSIIFAAPWAIEKPEPMQRAKSLAFRGGLPESA